MAFTRNFVPATTNDTSIEKWNSAKEYSNVMIMKNLVECDILIRIAIYGAEQINDSVLLDYNIKVMNRLEAIKRIIDIELIIIENTIKFLKREDKVSLDKVRGQINLIDNKKDGLEKIEYNMGTNEQALNINEVFFNLCLKALRKYKEEIIGLLNSNGLIFREIEDVDLEKIKDEIIEGG